MKISQFQITGQRLLKCDFIVNESYKPNEAGIDLKISNTVDIKKNEVERQAKVTLILNIFDKVDFENCPFTINLEIEGYFIWQNEIDDKINQYLERNAPAVLLSYLRGIVSQLTSFAGFPPLILPLMDFSKKV